jgi:cytosine/adenosine deaminase-related metal-dependent hydrolase
LQHSKSREPNIRPVRGSSNISTCSMPKQVKARWLIVDPFHVHLDGGVVIGDDGRIAEVLDEASSASARSRADTWETLDLGEAVLMPGLVNAHAHLELSTLALDPSGSFDQWIAKVIGARANMTAEDYERAVQVGAARLLQTGTTCVGDLDSTGASETVLDHSPLRARVYREVLDGGNAARTGQELETLRRPFTGGPGLYAGIAPHAPHTVSDTLLEACAAVSMNQGLPLSVHWAETPEECEWLSKGTGPFSDFLGASPGCTGLQRLQRAGMLDGALSLTHGNHPGPGELEALGASGATVVHCPGSHAYFGRPAISLDAWIAAGVQIALGTDSSASNGDLDMRREMSLVRREHPGLHAETVLEWATRGGARALGLGDQIGELQVGRWADLVALQSTVHTDAREMIDEVTSSCPSVLGVWVAGNRV